MAAPDPTLFPTGQEPAAESPLDPILHVHQDVALDRIFTAREETLVRRAQEFAREGVPYAQDLKKALDTGLRGLGFIALAIETYPSLKEKRSLGGKERSFDSLITNLVEGTEHGFEWSLPTKAILSRSFGIAKVNFFTSLQYVVDGCKEAPGAAALLAEVNAAIEEAVYTRLAEELYGAFITSLTTSRQVKELAAKQSIALWEGRIRLVTDRFCPILRSAWHARTLAPRVFGTLMGASEIFTLLFQDCDQKFIEWFGGFADGSEQHEAFEEFLFDLPWENLQRVRQRMREDGKSAVGPREVERYLGFKKNTLRPLVGDPKSLYVSFRRRRVKAQYRSSMGVPGPKHTAEAYLLEALLLEEAGASSPSDGATPAP